MKNKKENRSVSKHLSINLEGAADSYYVHKTSPQ